MTVEVDIMSRTILGNSEQVSLDNRLVLFLHGSGDVFDGEGCPEESQSLVTHAEF